MGSGHRRSIRLVLVVGGIITALALPSAALADEAPTRTRSTFELVPESRSVRVTVEFQVTNLMPSTTTRDTITDYYLDESDILVDPHGVNFRATTPGGTARVSVMSPGEDFLSVATVRYPSTFYRQTRSVTLTYDIPSGAPRSENRTRAGMAYASFCAFPGGAYIGDLQSVRIVIPGRYDVERLDGETLTRSSSGGSTILASEEAATPAGDDAKVTCAEAVDDAAFVRTQHKSPGGISVTTEAWPEDPEWQRSVGRGVGETLERLEAAIGIAPASRRITVREVLPETLGGYAAAFDPEASVAHVGEDALDPVVAAHELAHAWFNDRFADEVWISEGYAEMFARSVLGPGVPACADPGDAAVSDARLGDWFYLPALASEEDHARVAAQYEVSCWIVTEVADRIGLDAMREIVAAAWHGQIAYVGEGRAEGFDAAPISWQKWLDLVDERGLVPAGETDLEWLQDLLLEAGATTDEAALADRAEARASYHELLAATDPWSAPIFIRRQLADWSFDDARESIAMATEIDAARDAAVQLVPELAESTGVENAYEEAASADQMSAALKLASEEREAAVTVAGAVSAAERDLNVIEWVGVIGEDLDADAAAAVDALVASDFDAARETADHAAKTSSDAALAGGLRLGGAAGVLAAVGGGYVLWRRRAQLRPGAGAPAGVTADTAATESATVPSLQEPML